MHFQLYIRKNILYKKNLAAITILKAISLPIIFTNDPTNKTHRTIPNIKNIQTSWLTVGADTAQLTLHGGANDMGSIMIEENVVSAAGAPHRFTANGIQKCITEAGFIPQLRNQLYDKRKMPEMIEQVINY